jgi:hypothetical protein
VSTEQEEMKINVDGVAVPISVAGDAVRRCIRGIQLIDRLITTQGFASREDLKGIKAGLTGDDRDENVASSGSAIS